MGYLDNRELAQAESHVERFFINLVLIRVLYAHALVVAPRLALGWLSPIGPILGDPRLVMTTIFIRCRGCCRAAIRRDGTSGTTSPTSTVPAGCTKRPPTATGRLA